MVVTKASRYLFSRTSYIGVIGCFLAISVTAAERHTEFDVPHEHRVDDGLEHIVVTGELQVSVESEKRAYLDHKRGMYLYSRGNYDEALRYLLSSAKHGYKESQARLAHLYLHGLGGVNRNDINGIAWMGVAAHGETTPIIRRHYDKLMAAVPPQHIAALKRVVEQYVAKYGNFNQNVVCETAKQAGTIIAKNRCFFEFEFAVLSALEIADMQDFYRNQIIPPDQWSSFTIMERVRGSEVPQPAPAQPQGSQ